MITIAIRSPATWRDTTETGSFHQWIPQIMTTTTRVPAVKSSSSAFRDPSNHNVDLLVTLGIQRWAPDAFATGRAGQGGSGMADPGTYDGW